MRHRSIHHGPVLRIAHWEAILVAAVSVAAIAVITAPVLGVGALLNDAVATLAEAFRL